MSNVVLVEFSKDEALILFEFLVRVHNNKNSNKKLITLFEDQSEQRVLWNLECTFERMLAEPFLQNYDEIIQDARNKIRDKNDFS